MKLLISSLFFLIASVTLAQADITPKVVDAIKKGDATAMGAHFMSPIDLTLNGKDETLNREQAVAALTKFFTSNNVKSFELKHQGTSKLEDQFRIGTLVTSTGEYRVTFFMKKNGAAMQIKQLTIEAD
jgi:Domain of unknown function (DUF4783)